MVKKLRSIICGALIVFFSINIGFTQEQEKQRELELNTMTVTAQKREENMQDVPVSISAFSGEDLYDSGIDDLSEVARFSPNVYMKRDSIVIRGISQYYGSKISAVGLYIDGVNLPFEGVNSSELFNVERIEVLKGPQGTLYGKNSESGVINIVTKQPGNELTGKLFGEYSWYDTEFGNSPVYIAGGNISGPIVNDKLYIGLAGKWKDDKGFVKNEYNNDEEAGEDTNYSGRLNIKWIPQDRWDISLITDAMNKDDNATAYFKYVGGSLSEGRHKMSYDGPYYGENNGDGQTLNVKYSGDRFNIVSITGRRNAKNELDCDFDLTSIPSWASESYVIDESTTYSQEIRISSPKSNSPFQWLSGIYTFNEDMDIYQQKVFQSGTTTRDSDVDNYGYAFFGQGTYTFIDKLHCTVGLRYDYVDFEGEQHLTTSNGQSVYGKDFDNSEILPKLAISYDFSDKIMAYTSITRGYLTGGYNFKWATNADNLTYDPEYTWNYEVGMKSSWFENRLLANLSAFYIKMKDKQVAEWDTSSNVASVKQIQNAANAYSAGVELDMQARPVQGVTLSAGLGFTEAKIDNWVATEYNSTTGQAYQYDYKDKELPNVPEYTYNLGFSYRHLSGFFCRADLLGTGALYSDSKNSAKEDGYQIVNFRLGFEKEEYDIQLWCTNLLDEEYLKVRFASVGDYTGLEGDPRMIGVTMTYRF